MEIMFVGVFSNPFFDQFREVVAAVVYFCVQVEVCTDFNAHFHGNCAAVFNHVVEFFLYGVEQVVHFGFDGFLRKLFEVFSIKFRTGGYLIRQ